MKKTSHNQFICFKPNKAAEQKIICFPPAGMGASFYSKWHHRLSSDAEVWAAQLPGREFLLDKSIPSKFTDLMNQITIDLPELTDSKISLYGHSFGAALAFNAANWLEDYEKPAIRLIVSARKSMQTQYQLLVSQLDDSDLIEYVKDLGGLENDNYIDEIYLKNFLNLLRSDLKLNEDVNTEASPINTPIDYIFAKNDIAIDMKEAKKWSILTKERYTLHEVEGNHLFPMEKNHCCYELINTILSN